MTNPACGQEGVELLGEELPHVEVQGRFGAPYAVEVVVGHMIDLGRGVVANLRRNHDPHARFWIDVVADRGAGAGRRGEQRQRRVVHFQYEASAVDQVPQDRRETPIDFFARDEVHHRVGRKENELELLSEVEVSHVCGGDRDLERT